MKKESTTVIGYCVTDFRKNWEERVGVIHKWPQPWGLPLPRGLGGARFEAPASVVCRTIRSQGSQCVFDLQQDFLLVGSGATES